MQALKQDVILLGHGSGGKLGHQLLEDLILPALSSHAPCRQDDAAVLPIGSESMAFTTDSYVVDPIFFPGGDIGMLAVNGTINDLAMSGARPLVISAGLILEEGLPIAELRTILASMRQAADAAGVQIVTGDTKVVPRGKADRIFINTSGVGVCDSEVLPHGGGARPGDKILINGTIGDHGMAVMAGREGLQLASTIASDTAALNGLVADLLQGIGNAVHVLRDPTRGGVATTLKEIALQSTADLRLQEQALPVSAPVRGACAILGLDPLFVANEGKLLAFVAPEAAETALGIMQKHPLGREAAIIGEVTAMSSGRVFMQTAIGGLRAIEMLSGEQLPRIC